MTGISEREWRDLARELRVVVYAVMGTGPDAIVATRDIPPPKRSEFEGYVDEVKRIVGRARADVLRQFFERWDARLLAEPLGLKTLTEEA